MDNAVVLDVPESHRNLDDQINDLFLVPDREGQIIERFVSCLLHHNAEKSFSLKDKYDLTTLGW